MKILFVNQDRGWGGGQEHLKDLAEEFSHADLLPFFFCRSGSPSEKYFTDKGYPVYPFKGNFCGLVKRLIQKIFIFSREKFDVVLVTREHDLFGTALAWILALPFRKKGKLVVCYHTATSRKQWAIGIADAVGCVSSYVRDKLLEGKSLPVKSVKILPNGIPAKGKISAEKFDVNRKRRHFKGVGFPLIGMVGSFFKNQQELISILPLIRNEFPNITLALVGDDSDAGLMNPVLERIVHLQLENNLIITGKVCHEVMEDIFFDFDLSVSTFRNEGFGLVHLESLVAGTPVVTFNQGGQVDFLVGENVGTLVNGGSEEFATAVIELLKDHQKRFAMGKRGHALVKNKYSVEKMAESYRSLFSELQ